jgi:hypothetical protein
LEAEHENHRPANAWIIMELVLIWVVGRAD